jgi:transcriptional regulator with XRE-family HTH domain
MTERNLGKIIRERRKELFPDMNMKTFAEAMHVSHSYLSSVETNDLLPLSESVIKSFSRKLKLNHDYLLAAAGKISGEIMEIICSDPIFYTDTLRKLSRERGVKK